MTATARDDIRPLGEAALLTKLIAAAHDSPEQHLSQGEVDSILEVSTPAQVS